MTTTNHPHWATLSQRQQRAINRASGLTAHHNRLRALDDQERQRCTPPPPREALARAADRICGERYAAQLRIRARIEEVRAA